MRENRRRVLLEVCSSSTGTLWPGPTKASKDTAMCGARMEKRRSLASDADNPCVGSMLGGRLTHRAISGERAHTERNGAARGQLAGR